MLTVGAFCLQLSFFACGLFRLAIALPWHGGANWKIPGSAPGSAPRGAPGNRGALGGAAQANRGPPHWAPSGALLGAPPVSLSSTPQSAPISQGTPGSTSLNTSRDFPVSPVPGQGDCKHRSPLQAKSFNCQKKLQLSARKLLKTTASKEVAKLVFKGKRRKIHIHQRAFKVVVGDPFAQYWCSDFGLL